MGPSAVCAAFDVGELDLSRVGTGCRESRQRVHRSRPRARAGTNRLAAPFCTSRDDGGGYPSRAAPGDHRRPRVRLTPTPVPRLPRPAKAIPSRRITYSGVRDLAGRIAASTCGSCRGVRVPRFDPAGGHYRAARRSLPVRSCLRPSTVEGATSLPDTVRGTLRLPPHFPAKGGVRDVVRPLAPCCAAGVYRERCGAGRATSSPAGQTLATASSSGSSAPPCRLVRVELRAASGNRLRRGPGGTLTASFPTWIPVWPPNRPPLSGGIGALDVVMATPSLTTFRAGHHRRSS